jgi:hypothetical protein
MQVRREWVPAVAVPLLNGRAVGKWFNYQCVAECPSTRPAERKPSSYNVATAPSDVAHGIHGSSSQHQADGLSAVIMKRACSCSRKESLGLALHARNLECKSSSY